MKRTGMAAAVLALVVSLTIAAPLISPPVHGQPPTPVPTATPDASARTETVPTMAAADLMDFVLVLVLFALAILLILFVYIAFIQTRFYRVVERSARIGASFRATQVSAVAVARQAGVAPQTGQSLLAIDGPTTVTVGKVSDEFKLLGHTGDGSDIQWTVEPRDAAQVLPDRGRRSASSPRPPVHSR